MTQYHSNNGQREILTCFTAIIFALFGLMVGGAFLIYAWPQPEKVNIGPLTHFPPTSKPYRVEAKELFYLVHTSNQVLVFKPETPHYTNHRYQWSEFSRRFEDPLTGSRFKIDGTYVCGPAERNLDQFEYEIKAGDLWVNLAKITKGEAVLKQNTGPYACIAEEVKFFSPDISILSITWA